MLLFAAAFAGVFAVGFGTLVYRALRFGTVMGIGWRASRSDKPIVFWLMVSGYSINASFAVLFTAILSALAFGK